MQPEVTESRQQLDERQVTVFAKALLALFVASIAAYLLYCVSVPHARYVFVVCYCFQYAFAPALVWLSLTVFFRYGHKRFLVSALLAGLLTILLISMPLVALDHYREFDASWFRNPFYFPASGPDM